MRKASRSAILISALALSACSIRGGPDLDRSQIPVAPDNWAARSDITLSENPFSEGWVATFGDTDLVEAIRNSFQRNRNLRSVLAQLDAARAASRITRADLFPRVDLSLGGSDPDNAGALYTGNLEASWEADIWGRNRALAGAGNADFRAAAADYAGARQALAASLSRAWYDRAAARQTYDLSVRDQETRKDTLRITDARFRAGLASRLDVRLAQTALSNSEAQLAAATRSSQNASRALEVLTGLYPAAEAQGAAVLIAPPPLPQITQPVSVLAGRPDLVAAEARLEAAGLRAKDARHAMLPRLTLSFSSNSQSTNLGDIFDPGTYVNAIAGGLLQPLFRGGALLAEADRQGSLAQSALFDYAEAALNAYREVEDALDAEETFASQVAATAVAAEEARIAVRLTRSRYINGRSTIFDLLNAQTTAIAAEIRAVEAQRARIENRINLHLALGTEPLAI